MAGLSSRLAAHGKRRIAFTVVVLVALVLYLAQSWWHQAFLVAGWFENGLGVLPTDNGHHLLHIGHRLHNLALAVVMWPFLLGMAAQLRSPTRHTTGMLMALSVWVVGIVAIALTGVWALSIIVVILGVPTLIATLLHPRGRELLTSIDPSRVNRILLVLVVVAAVPMLAYAATQTQLQTGAIEPSGHAHAGSLHEEIHQEHVGGGHYLRLAWLAFAIIGTGTLASLRQSGWWLGAWVAGLMAVVLGVSGLLAPSAASNPGLLWNFGAIVWGVGFVGVAELTQDTQAPTPLGTWRQGPMSTR